MYYLAFKVCLLSFVRFSCALQSTNVELKPATPALVLLENLYRNLAPHL
jgi:hypothetical protein